MLENFQNYLKSKAGLTDEQYDTLAKNIRTKSVSKGSFLLRRGEICRHNFFVEKGLLRFYSISEDGKEHIVHFAPETWIIGDRGSIYFNEPSEFYIDAIEDSEVVMLDEDFGLKASELSASYRKFNARALQNHVRHLQLRINLLIGATAEARYMDFIKLYPDLTLRVPQWMIASFLGITAESLSRVRKELARKNGPKKL